MTAVPDTTLVFATMDRPHAVQRFVYSIRARFPHLPICVADQTAPTAYMREFYERQRVDVVWVPHDTGVGACRNLLIEKTSTPLVFMCDDDLVFTNDTDFTPCLEILKHDPEVGIIGGQWLDKHGDGPEVARRFAIFLDLDPKRKTLTGIPAYHYFPKVRHVGVHKYFLCDTAMNFSFIRRSVFENENVRWDDRFKCNGEHEDFYLNFKTASDYLVAFYPGLVCRHRRPPAHAYERLRERAEGWRLFMEKWGIEQYCELDNGTRLVTEPGTVHKGRHWGDFFANTGLVSEPERGNPRISISLTDDLQVILATHFDRETGARVRSRRATASLYLAGGQLVAAGGVSEREDPEGRQARALADLVRSRSNVELHFRGPAQVRAGDEIFLFVEAMNTGDTPLAVGNGALFEGAFSCSFRRDGVLSAIHEEATACFADLPVGVHEQLVCVSAPTVPGTYELAVRLIAGNALVLGEPATAMLHVAPRDRTGLAASPLESPLVDSAIAAAEREPDSLSGETRLARIRGQLRTTPVLRLDVSGPGAFLVFALECASSAEDESQGVSEVLVTYHWKKGGEYLAWDVQRTQLSGLRPGRQVRALLVERPSEAGVDIEVAAVVPGAGYAPLFRVPCPGMQRAAAPA